LKSFLALLSFLLLPFSLAFTSETAGNPSADQECKAKNLFIIVANGVRYDDALGHKMHLYIENIWTRLRPLGTIFTNFYNTGLTYPLPAQATLLTGVWHTTKNPLDVTTRPAFPTFFEYWKKKDSINTCYFAVNKKQFVILAHSDHREYGSTYAPLFDTATANSLDTSLKNTGMTPMENAIYTTATSYIFKHHPSFVYLNLDSGSANEAHLNEHECRVDGCEEGGALNTYYESIILTDTIVYDLWDRIQRDKVYKDKSIFIFISTHGRHTSDFHGFGDNCRGCQRLNVLIIGPGVKKNFISKKKRTLIDICPTVGTLCDIPTPYVKGKVMNEVFEQSAAARDHDRLFNRDGFVSDGSRPDSE
jgi:hypothetical protein